MLPPCQLAQCDACVIIPLNSLWNFNRKFTTVYKYVYRPHLIDHKVHTKPTWTQPSQMYSAHSTHQLVASVFSTWQLVHFRSFVLDSFCTLSASQPASSRNWFSIMFFERQCTRHTVHMTTLFSETYRLKYKASGNHYRSNKTLILNMSQGTNFGTKIQCKSSSIGTTAHCGLWPVTQCPSIFSYLPPTLSSFSLPVLEALFLLPLSILSWVFPFFSSLPVLEWRSFWASYPPPFSLGDLTSLSFALLSILLYFLLWLSLLVLDLSDFSIPRFHI